MEDPIRAYRSILLSNGYLPVDIWSHDQAWLGKSAGKAPYGEDWGERARARAGLTEWPSKTDNIRQFNTGILCDGLRVIDCDVDDDRLSASIGILMYEILGQQPVYRFRDGSPRFLTPYKAVLEHAPKRKIHNKITNHGVEVLGYGQQCVTFGIHHSGQELKWSEEGLVDLKKDNLPVVTEDQVTMFLDACKELLDIKEETKPTVHSSVRVPLTNIVANGSSGISETDLEDLISNLPNNNPHYDDWCGYINAIRFASNASSFGLQLAHRWSSKSGKYNRHFTDKTWNTLEKYPMHHDVGFLINRMKDHEPKYVKQSILDSEWYKKQEFEINMREFKLAQKGLENE